MFLEKRIQLDQQHERQRLLVLFLLIHFEWINLRLDQILHWEPFVKVLHPVGDILDGCDHFYLVEELVHRGLFLKDEGEEKLKEDVLQHAYLLGKELWDDGVSLG